MKGISLKSMQRLALTLASLAAAAVLPMTAAAATPAPLLGCGLSAGAMADGWSGGYDITTTKPPQVRVRDGFPMFNSTANATSYYTEEAGGRSSYSGLILQGSNMYATRVTYDGVAQQPTVSATRIGTGWSTFRQLSRSNYVQGTKPHSYLYALNTNGSLYRYTTASGIRSWGSAPGFSSLKAMTLIAETATYDTLLATTTGGALYTIRIPATASIKPIVKKVRSTGYSAFESLVVQRCGTSGSVLAAFDDDANRVSIYALTRATGESTVIKSIGTGDAGWRPPQYFLLTGARGPQLVGE